ncbi:PAS domain S-box-containing protein/diguanylate cyclase (GGDEF) domain-containing protein [Halopseudomonas litoralis]|uniref:cyclic-guanylate-specific phosphodiesterase n=1 Tax=Halopseudomonas litoralis TaxID=797277 RepID=A0A1H1WCE3_9GAMM|nr:EAL domain-containing protein [Halopseudomonas litoralis]SDS94652.1 PAS domain S-box-containing protein/diguanylate cyclase (GGDEF) domain-containing protein [Halopseudomonas litoralis]
MPHSLKSVALMLLITAVIMNLFMVTLLAVTLNSAYDRKIEEVRTTVTNLALLMDQSVTGAAREVDLVLRKVQSRLETALRVGESLETSPASELTGAGEGWIADAADIHITDATGLVQFEQQADEGRWVDYGDRDYFLTHRTNPDAGMLVSGLLRNHSGEWVHVFSRRYNDPDGRFAGVTVAAIPAQHFAGLISGLNLGPNGIALIRDLNKTLVARHPPLDAAPGRIGSVGGSQELTALLESGEQAGIFYSHGTADGVPRTDAFRRLSAMPVFVVAGLGEDDYLAIWRHDVNRAIVLGLLFLLVTAGGALLLWRQFKASDKAHRRSQMLLQHASDGIHILDEHGQLVDASEAFYQMLGYTPGELSGRHPCDWDAQHSPEEMTQLFNSLLSGGQISTFETRFRHKLGHAFAVEVSTVRVEIEGRPLLFSSARDITERKKADEDLRIAAQAFESQVGMLITDADLNILRCNQAFCRITGYSAKEVIGRQPNLLQSGRHDQRFYADMWQAINRSGAWQGEIWNKRKNGEIYPQLLSIGKVSNEHGQTTHYVASLSDISARKASEEQMRTLAFYDSLTKLPNRRLFLDRLEEARGTAKRRETYSALLVVDLNDFKILNDAEGYTAGDRMLEQVATRLISCVPHTESVARLGGDEFVVLLEDLGKHEIDAAHQAEQMGNRILQELARPYVLGETEYRGSASIGIALFGASYSILSMEPLKRAELAMSQAKSTGNSPLCFFDPQMQAQVRERSEIDAGLRMALEKQQFLLHYQPQVDDTGQIIGAEALVRWKHPEQGLISPARFIPVAEDNGLILPLGHWVLETACQQLALWADNPARAHLTIAVNISAKQLSQAHFVDQVMEVLQRTGAPAQRLKLELTESALVHEIESIIDKMNSLKMHGVGFSLDDFGTGYSSLAYLKRLPLDQLKIDQSFVRDISFDANSADIAQTIILLAERMKISVLAEGVETQLQQSALRERGCHHYQGYLFGRPMPIEEFEGELLRR